MTDPKWAVEINKVRWYFNPNKFNGEPKFLSVTYICNALEKGGLMHWAAMEVATEAVDHQERWIHRPRDGAWKHLRWSPFENRDDAAERGSDGHEAAEKALRGEDISHLAEKDPKIRHLLNMLHECKFRPKALESSVFSDRHLVAGSFDFLGTLGGRIGASLSLVDFKFGKNVHQDFAIQVHGAYGATAEYLLDDDGKEHEWQPPESYYIAHITADGWALHPIEPLESNRRAFLACLELRRWQRTKPVGDPLPREVPLDVEWIRSTIAKMEQADKLELSKLFVEAGLPTRPTLWTDAELDKAVGLVTLYQMREKETESA